MFGAHKRKHIFVSCRQHIRANIYGRMYDEIRRPDNVRGSIDARKTEPKTLLAPISAWEKRAASFGRL